MGGKSTFMRQTALIALMAYVGSYVPAKSACFGPIDRIFTRIGAADDLAGGRSTFMVEMTEAAAILNDATPQSLVLMDEIGRGTSTFDGLALAWAIARHLLAHNACYTLFATHYFELTQLPAEFPQAANVHLSAVEHGHGIVFLHAVNEGPANQSYGLQVAQLAGVPAPVIRAARKHLAYLEQQSASQHTPQLDLFSAPPAAADDLECADAPALPDTPHPALENCATSIPTISSRARRSTCCTNCARWSGRTMSTDTRKRILCGLPARTAAMLVAAALALAQATALAAPPKRSTTPYSFAVVSGVINAPADEPAAQRLLDAIARERNLAFVVYAGDLKGSKEACRDALYSQRARSWMRHACRSCSFPATTTG